MTKLGPIFKFQTFRGRAFLMAPINFGYLNVKWIISYLFDGAGRDELLGTNLSVDHDGPIFVDWHTLGWFDQVWSDVQKYFSTDKLFPLPGIEPGAASSEVTARTSTSSVIKLGNF